MGYQKISNTQKSSKGGRNKKDTRHTQTNNKIEDIDSTLSVIKLKINRRKN